MIDFDDSQLIGGQNLTFMDPKRAKLAKRAPGGGGGGGPGGPKGPFPCVYISDQLTCLESESMGFLMGEK